MKTGLAAFAAGLFSLTANAEGFRITGTVKAMPDSCIVSLIDTEKGENGKKIAETVAADDNFTLTGDIASPTLCNLNFGTRMKDGRLRRFASVPVMLGNDQVTVITDKTAEEIGKMSHTETAFTVTGGEAQRQYQEYVDACGEADREQEKASYLNAMKYFESNDNPDTMAVYDKIKKDAYNRFAALRDEFVKKHPSYFISAALTKQEMLKQYLYTGDELKAMRKMMKAVPDTARQSMFDRLLDFSLRYCKAMPCPDFEMTSDGGKVSKLSEIKANGKYTFIDIWASWCGPCRAAIPHVKELAQKYGDRLQIMSISVDEEEDAWRKAMKEEQMPWAQYRLAPGDQFNTAGRLLNISSIPRLILLNEKGEIVCSTNLPKEVTAVIETRL